MNSVISYTLLLQIIFSASFAQSSGSGGDTTNINNFVLPPDYKCSTLGEIPDYTKSGHGKKTLVLIPGLGFDKSVFDDFVKDYQKEYKIYAITIPGYGNTQAPPLPPEGTSFGDQSWNKSILQGIRKLIVKEHIKEAILVGHFVQGTQLALRMAIDFPQLIGGVIVLGGPAKFVLIQRGKPLEFPLASTINYIDKVTGPTWFRKISKEDFDAGNYLPEVYSLNPQVGMALWKQSAAVPLPVYIHSLCEFFASDITLETSKIKCPVLVLRPTFNQHIFQNSINNYLTPQFRAAWDKVSSTNSLFTIVDIPDASIFVWKDNPSAVKREINSFIMK